MIKGTRRLEIWRRRLGMTATVALPADASHERPGGPLSSRVGRENSAARMAIREAGRHGRQAVSRSCSWERYPAAAVDQLHPGARRGSKRYELQRRNRRSGAARESEWRRSRPWLSGEKKAPLPRRSHPADPTVAGTMVFAELGAQERPGETARGTDGSHSRGRLRPRSKGERTAASRSTASDGNRKGTCS